MEGARNEITWNAPRKYSQLGTICCGMVVVY